MGARTAVFCFHDLLPDDAAARVTATHLPYVLGPEEFRTYLLAIKATERRAIPVSELIFDLAGGTVVLTFDDGCASDYREAYPALRELGMRATFFVVPSYVGTPGYVTWAELREMVAGGMEIGSHSLTHPFMDALDESGVAREFGQSKAILEDRLGCAVTAASLPRGSEPKSFRGVLRDLGYAAFCTSRVGWWYPGTNPFVIPRIGVRRGTAIDEVAAITAGAPRALWRMQGVDAAKSAVKRVVGRRGWSRLRAPILALKERL